MKTDYVRLTAVINENNALRKNTERLTARLREANEALARAHDMAAKAGGRAEEYASALRRQRADRTLELEAEWNAAIDDVVLKVHANVDSQNITAQQACGILDDVRALKRKVNP